jgi:hypothetical protein
LTILRLFILVFLGISSFYLSDTYIAILFFISAEKFFSRFGVGWW